MVNSNPSQDLALRKLELPLERDVFLRELIRQLADVLEDIVGVEEAAGFISVVGQRVGTWINQDYRRALGVSSLTREQVDQVLVDLKRRIQGEFFVIDQDETKVVLGNKRCPFAEKVRGHPSLCMMTSNVFGVVSAENLEYAKVDIQKAIAYGDPQCRVVVYLKPTQEAQDADGREYHKADE